MLDLTLSFFFASLFKQLNNFEIFYVFSVRTTLQGVSNENLVPSSYWGEALTSYHFGMGTLPPCLCICVCVCVYCDNYYFCLCYIFGTSYPVPHKIFFFLSFYNRFLTFIVLLQSWKSYSYLSFEYLFILLQSGIW